MKKNILIVGQTPPPYHGQAVVTDMLFKNDWRELRVECIRMSYSEDIESVGGFSFSKVIHLFALIWKTYKVRFRHKIRVLYYPPASANMVPILRDFIYLTAVRWMFSETIWHFHAGGVPEFLEKHPVLRTLSRYCYGKPSVCIEIHKAKLSAGKYFHAKKSIIIPNGLSIKIIDQSSASKIFSILYIGALNKGKGVLDIIETAHILQKMGHRFKIKLVGASSTKKFTQEIKKLLTKYKLTEKIELVGPLTGKKKLDAYAGADCFFFPSHYEAENFPLVLIEAMAYGLPIISTKWRGIPELIGESSCAILCDIKSPKQYGVALKEIMKDKQLLKQMGLNAKEHYKNNYTQEHFLNKMEKEFEQLCKR